MIKLFKILKLALSKSNSNYDFKLSEKLISAKVFYEGYPGYQESVISDNENFLKVCIDNFTFFVPKNTFKAGELSYLYGEVFAAAKVNPHAYEQNFIMINKGDIVIDAGACEGFFIKYALNKNAKKIYAFEPLKILEQSLISTFEEKIHQGTVEIISKGLSNNKGISKINISKQYICEANIDENGSEAIEINSIDEFMTEKNINKIDFIKMDIEGAEYQALFGAQNLIRSLKPKISVAVYHAYSTAKEVKELLLSINPDYKIAFGGCFMFESPYRPYMLYAY